MKLVSFCEEQRKVKQLIFSWHFFNIYMNEEIVYKERTILLLDVEDAAPELTRLVLLFQFSSLSFVLFVNLHVVP